MLVSRSIKVIMIVLDDNLKPTGERKEFESYGKAAIAVSQTSTQISNILNSEYYRKTATDKKTGNTVTFVRAEATEEEIAKWLKEVENKRKQLIQVNMIVFDENLQPTGGCKEFRSQAEAGRAISQPKENIAQILNPSHYRKTTTDKRTGNTVTFVRADSTKEEILEWLKEVENKENQPLKIKVVYVEGGKAEYFDSARKAGMATGIDNTTITNDIKKKFKKPHKRYHKETGEEIKFYEA